MPRPPILNIIGKKFNRLEVLSFAYIKDRRSYFNCKCDCGKEKILSGHVIRNGYVKSCGCLLKDNKGCLPNVDIVGKKIGYLTIIKYDKSTNNGPYFLCKCDCGNIKSILGRSIKIGVTTSCGCRRHTINLRTHGESNTRLHTIWLSMRDRCNNTNNPVYDSYGGRGIKVCSEWNKYENFREWAYKNGYTNKLTIDRINNNGGYEPNNCRWATRKEQANNTRNTIYLTYKGERKTIAQWADKLKFISKRNIQNRYYLGWPIEKILTTPINKSKSYYHGKGKGIYY